MRLNHASAIKSIIKSYDNTAKIYLYGSRTDDTRLGGDIDLLVLSRRINLRDKIKILSEIYSLIGEQRIDLTISGDIADPFVKHAFETGVEI